MVEKMSLALQVQNIGNGIYRKYIETKRVMISLQCQKKQNEAV